MKGSDHLDFLLDHRLLQAVSTPQMEGIYSKLDPQRLKPFTFVTRSQVLQGNDPEETMLLDESSPALVAGRLGVPQLSTEVDRAVRQIKERLSPRS